MSCSLLLRRRNISDKSCRENQNTILYSITPFFRKSCRLWDEVEKYCRAGQATDDNIIRHMRFAYWITEATNTYPEYIILIVLARQQRLRERALCYVLRNSLSCQIWARIPDTMKWVCVLPQSVHANSGIVTQIRQPLHMKYFRRIKVKWSRYRPGVAQRVGRGIALLFHDRGTIRGWVVSSTPRPHLTPGKGPVSILQEAGWAPGPVWTGGKSRPNRDSIPVHPAHSSVAIPTELHGPHCFFHTLPYSFFTRQALIQTEPKLYEAPLTKAHLSEISKRDSISIKSSR